MMAKPQERSQITAFETDALIESLVELGRPLTDAERRVALCVCHFFTAKLIDCQDQMLHLHREQAG